MEEIKVGQELYYLGIGWGMKDKCYEIFNKDGIRYVRTNHNVVRKESDVLNNSCDLYTDKDKINARLRGSYMAKLID